MEVAVVSALLKTLAGPVGTLAAGEFSLLCGLEEDIARLRGHLEVIEPLIEVAEEEQETRKDVHAWLRSLKRVAYDADDVFDELELEVARRPRLLVREDAGALTRLVELVSACFLSCFTATPNPLILRHQMGSKIKNITTRFSDIIGRQGLLNLSASSASSLPETSRTRETTHLRDARLPFLGRKEEKEEIVEMLCRTTDGRVGGDARVCVVAIVGLGGIGKTTLAQEIYNDDRMKRQFPKLRKWLFVGEKFDGPKLIRQLIGEQDDKKSKDELYAHLRDLIIDDRFFIVLDDIWTDKHHEWDELFAPLAFSRKGGAVLVTSRSWNVAKTMGEGDVFVKELKPLTYVECLSIFEKCAFGNLDPMSYPDLTQVGKEIVQKVGGSPLAAKALGGFLCKKLQKEEWEKVLHSEVWSQELCENNILPILRLSYRKLPSYLKPCFAYCAIFPKDFSFGRETLVSWST